MSNVGRLLLAYEPNEELAEKSFIIDWSHRERVLGGHKDDLGKNPYTEISTLDRIAAEKLYWESRVPLVDFIESPDAIEEIVLPEVITPCNVPGDLIEIADHQPRMQDMNPWTRKALSLAIGHSPELETLMA